MKDLGTSIENARSSTYTSM